MTRLWVCSFSVLLLSGVVLGQGVPTTDKPRTITIPSSSATPVTATAALETTTTSSTTSAPVTSTTSPATKSTTTAPTTTSTTTAPTTTSTTPAPTTTSTTPAPTTTSTTPAPTTTPAPITTPAPKPTPAPTPLPPPTQGTWSYTEKNITCIVLQFAAQLNVTYSTNVNGSQKLAHALLNVPVDATVVGGACGNDTQWIQLSWPNTTWANNLTAQFTRNGTTQAYQLRALNITLTPDQNFPNASSNATMRLWHASPEWSTPLATSYRCTAPTQLAMTEDEGPAVAALTLSRLQEQAWRSAPGTGFSAARDCGGGDVPDAVPIAVGCALGGLVLVVLIAYLVGRRRSAARGYLSM